jgi:carbon monoxide dehydrogenase subunit G
MKLKNEFEVEADAERTWALLTDLERIMPCMPGAALEGRDGDTFLGNVKVKVGPIGAHFKGSAYFAEKNDLTHSAVITAAGKDPRGQAAASAQIHAWLEHVTPTRTRVLIDTDLDISGRMAQFGRGAIADVSNRLITQFVANIEALLEAPATASLTGHPEVTAAQQSTAQAPPAQAPPGRAARDEESSMDLLGLVVPMVKERFGQAIAGGLLGFVLSWLVFGRAQRRGPRA